MGKEQKYNKEELLTWYKINKTPADRIINKLRKRPFEGVAGLPGGSGDGKIGTEYRGSGWVDKNSLQAF